MKPRYIVMEIRTNADGTISNTVTSFDADDLEHAENKYHSVLAAAAISDKPIHSAILLTADGFPLDHKYYEHKVAEGGE